MKQPTQHQLPTPVYNLPAHLDTAVGQRRYTAHLGIALLAVMLGILESIHAERNPAEPHAKRKHDVKEGEPENHQTNSHPVGCGADASIDFLSATVGALGQNGRMAGKRRQSIRHRRRDGLHVDLGGLHRFCYRKGLFQIGDIGSSRSTSTRRFVFLSSQPAHDLFFQISLSERFECQCPRQRIPRDVSRVAWWHQLDTCTSHVVKSTIYSSAKRLPKWRCEPDLFPCSGRHTEA